MMTSTDTPPRAWIGCLGCYNSGRLHGDWIEGTSANDADELRAAGIIDSFGSCPHCGAEELWTFDHEGYAGLIRGECSPAHAQRLAELLDDVDEPEAFAHYADHCGDVDYALETFDEAYAGEWWSLREYAEELADDLGWLRALESAGINASYFDAAAFARDLKLGGDVWVAAAPGLRVYVFCNHV